MSATNAREFIIRQLAAELTGPMTEVLMNGFYNEGSASIVRPKSNPTRKALVRRGLVHDGDNRWTALGREVARHLPPSWNSAAIKSLDELHDLAIVEDWVRTAAAAGIPVAYDGQGGVIIPRKQPDDLIGKTVKVVGVGGATNVRHGVVVDVTEGGRSVHVRVSDGHILVADSLNVEIAEPASGARCSEDTCVAKVGGPFHMSECGKPVHYLTAEQAVAADRGIYSGWRHIDRADDQGHHGVPARVIR